MRTVNDMVAVEVFTFTEDKEVSNSRLIIKDHLTSSMVSTKVLFDSKSFKAGDTVYFSSEQRNNRMIKMKYTVGDKTFLLMPESTVSLVEGAQ